MDSRWFGIGAGGDHGRSEKWIRAPELIHRLSVDVHETRAIACRASDFVVWNARYREGRIELTSQHRVGRLSSRDAERPERIGGVWAQQELGGHGAAGARRADADAKAFQVVDRARTRSGPDEEMNG